MLLLEPNRSPYDLEWRMFGTHVRVHPFFWLVSALLGWPLVEHGGLMQLAAWMACCFVSILLHEFGHVWMGRVFGSHGHIVLYSFGGLAIGSNDLANRWQRIAVSFAGPLIQLALWGVLRVSLPWILPGWLHHDEPNAMTELGLATLLFLLQINLFWPMLNLLPIWPLDGGQISRNFLEWLAPRNGTRIALGISFVAAGLLAINALVTHFRPEPLIPWLYAGGLFGALLFGALAVGSYQAMQMEEQTRAPWERWD